MKNILLIAALAFAVSGTSAYAQRVSNPLGMAPVIASDPIEENLVQVHRKHKKYKRYSKKHSRKHHRNDVIYFELFFGPRYNSDRSHHRYYRDRNRNRNYNMKRSFEDQLYRLQKKRLLNQR